MKLLKSLLFASSIILSPMALQAQECFLDWDNIYFKDLEGNMEYNFKSKKMERQFRTYKVFQGDFPQKVSLNIPFKGDCSQVKFPEVQSFRKIGPRAFVGHEEDHESHALDPKNMKFEEKAFESISPQVKVGKKVVSLTSFKIYEALSTLDFKKYHPWQIRYEILYKDANGLDNKKEVFVDLKLTH